MNLGQQYNAIFPEKSIDEFGDLVSFESAMGTGPWTPTEYSPGSFLKIEKHADYWNDGFPYIDVVEEIFISEYPAADAAFRSGQLDITAIDTDCCQLGIYRPLPGQSHSRGNGLLTRLLESSPTR